MKVVTPLLKRLVYPCLAAAGYFERSADPGFCAVTYHGVLPSGYRSKDGALDSALVSAKNLRAQVRLLKSRYNVSTPEEVLLWCEGKSKLPPRSVLVTCDDGLLNNVTDMLSVLLEENISCLFFVTGISAGDVVAMLWYEELYLIVQAAKPGDFTLSFGGANVPVHLADGSQRRAAWWKLVRELSQVDAATRYGLLERARSLSKLQTNYVSAILRDDALRKRFSLLTISGLKQLTNAGMSIGCHTITHPMLAKLPQQSAWSEISDSKSILEKALATTVWAFAYPFGDAESAEDREFIMAEKAGYKCAFLNAGRGVASGVPRFAMPRVHVAADMSLSEFEAHVSGFYGRVRERFGS